MNTWIQFNYPRNKEWKNNKITHYTGGFCVTHGYFSVPRTVSATWMVLEYLLEDGISGWRTQSQQLVSRRSTRAFCSQHLCRCMTYYRPPWRTEGQDGGGNPQLAANGAVSNSGFKCNLRLLLSETDLGETGLLGKLQRKLGFPSSLLLIHTHPTAFFIISFLLTISQKSELDTPPKACNLWKAELQQRTIHTDTHFQQCGGRSIGQIVQPRLPAASIWLDEPMWLTWPRLPQKWHI